MVNAGLFVVWLLAESVGLAATVPAPAPALDAWVAETGHASGEFPRVLAFASSLPDHGPPKFLTIDREEFDKLGFFRLAEQMSAAWDYKLNRAMVADDDSAVVVQELTKADTLVLAPDKGDWTVLKIKDGKRVVIATAKPAKSTKAVDLVAWLPEALGWDGVVLAKKGDFLLVGSTKALLAQPEIQALAVSDSRGKFTLKASERQGAGLLSLRETKGGVAVFDVVFLGQGVTDLPSGTKLLIEKKKE